MRRELSQRAMIVIGSVVLAILCLLPTIMRDSFTKNWFTRPLGLGLDISGGVHLVYQVKAKEAVKSRLQGWLQSIRSDLRNKKIAVSQYAVTDNNTVELSLLSGTFVDQAKKIIEENYKDLIASGQEDEGGRPKLIYSIAPKLVKQIEHDAIEQAVETLRNRVDQFGVAEPLIQRSGDDRIILQMPGVSDVQAVKNVVGSVAKLEFRLLPNGASNTYGKLTLKDKTTGAPVVVEDQALMTGDAVSDARVMIDSTGQVEVSLRLTNSGSQTFARITSENVNRQLAIILDGQVYSSPVIREAITQGQASISGGFTTEQAKQLQIVLKAGALPAPLEVMEERTVGPTLGMESIKKGLMAMGIGFFAIVIFMVIYYKKAGMVAVGTLVLNTILMIAALSGFGATLTLPGLAGLALTIGIAVDSNIIIFERIRDELRNGAGRDAAVNVGFEKAFGAIFDANVTTLLAGTVLYYFGTGLIKGFAVTLTIGVLTTLFCAVYVSRLCFDYFELKGPDRISI